MPSLQTSAIGLPQTQSMEFSAAASSKVRHRLKYETPREREERRKKFVRLMEDWQLTIGFKIHLQLKSKYKMFSTALC